MLAMAKIPHLAYDLPSPCGTIIGGICLPPLFLCAQDLYQCHNNFDAKVSEEVTRITSPNRMMKITRPKSFGEKVQDVNDCLAERWVNTIRDTYEILVAIE